MQSRCAIASAEEFTSHLRLPFAYGSVADRFEFPLPAAMLSAVPSISTHRCDDVMRRLRLYNFLPKKKESDHMTVNSNKVERPCDPIEIYSDRSRAVPMCVTQYATMSM